MGCKRLNTDFFNFLEIVHSKKSAPEEKKCINYYPFGLKHKGYNNVTTSNGNSVANAFKFNGQQLDESLGLNVTEMDFRQYDNALGRFSAIDEMSERSANLTPYRFGFNNPVSFNDPSGLYEKTKGGYKTSDQDEISALLYVLQNPGDSNPGGKSDKKSKDQKTIDVVFNYIERMEVENGDLASVDAVRLSPVTVKAGGSISGRQLTRLQNEIAFYGNRTGYLYNQKDHELREAQLRHNRNSPISRGILRNESNGVFEPLTSTNAVNYYGEQALRLMVYSSFSDMISSVSQGPVGINRSVNSRYLGRFTGNNSVRISPATNTSSTVSGQVSHGYFKNMSFNTFRAKFGHLYRGRFSGKGQYMRQMALSWRKLKAGL
jgi:RHS repeat-associated protein